MNYLVIGDIAGRYKELVQLINLAPEDAQIISCGDLVDRGEDTKSVLDLFMKEKYQAVRGNHEDMMIDCYRKGCKYEEGLWLLNGGVETVKSFLSIKDKIRFDQIYYAEKIDFNSLDRFIQMIPKKYIKYLEGLPYFISFDDFIVSHAPLIIKGNTFEKDFDFKFMWNRFPPMERYTKYQIFGHNGHTSVRRYSDKAGEYAICIDTCKEPSLTGILTKTRKLIKIKHC